MITEKQKDDIAMAIFGRKRKSNECVCCGSKKVSAGDFRTDIDRKEFEISRFCQKCQDETFSEE